MELEIRGVVCDGQGKGRSFTELDWVRQQFRDKIGFDPYPGTLNLRVKDAGALTALRTHAGVTIEPGAPGYCTAKCFRVQIYRERSRTISGRVTAVWIIPDVPGYPDDLVELMAPVSLRSVLGLKTGDAISIRSLDAEQVP